MDDKEKARIAQNKTNGASEEYRKKLKDLRWQQMRLKVFERDGWECRECFKGKDSGISLQAHHTYYRKGADPWDYPLESIVSLCEECHEEETHTRWQAEQELLKALREKGVLACDLEWLVTSLKTATLVTDLRMLIFDFGYILCDPDLQKLIEEKVQARL